MEQELKQEKITVYRNRGESEKKPAAAAITTTATTT